MGGKSKSRNETSSRSVNFNNVDYGGGGYGSGFAKNVNLSESSLSVGDVTATDHGAVTGALDYAGKATTATTQALMALGDRAYDDLNGSREFALEVFGQAGDAQANAGLLIDNATGRVLDFADRFGGEALRGMSDTTNNALDEVNYLATMAIDGLAGNQAMALQEVNQNTDRALAFASNSLRSEAGKTVETLTKILIFGAVGLSLVVVIAGKK